MNKQHIILDVEKIDEAAREFLKLAGGNKKFAFHGDMGAGKTTFITAVCKQLKAIDLVSSPTFSIVNEYETETEEIIYHFDFYRIKTPVELFDIGFEEYCLDNNWCFIEWPEKATQVIPDDFSYVSIKVVENGQREIHFVDPA